MPSAASATTVTKCQDCLFAWRRSDPNKLLGMMLGLGMKATGHSDVQRRPVRALVLIPVLYAGVDCEHVLSCTTIRSQFAVGSWLREFKSLVSRQSALVGHTFELQHLNPEHTSDPLAKARVLTAAASISSVLHCAPRHSWRNGWQPRTMCPGTALWCGNSVDSPTCCAPRRSP